jgi:DNA-binding transcriptional ArsR family regulator
MTPPPLHHPDADELELTTVLQALSDPHRLFVVRTLARSGEPRPCGSFGLPVSKSTATHHFRVLREAGVIRTEARGTARVSSLRREDLEVRFPGLLDAILAQAPAGADPAVPALG